jgi:hypothetical protein
MSLTKTLFFFPLGVTGHNQTHFYRYFLLLNSFHAKKRTIIRMIKKPFSKQFSRNFIKTSILKSPITLTKENPENESER